MDNISNQATLSYNNTTTNSNTVTTQILSLYNLTATKESLQTTYTPNQSITYLTRVENTGSASLYNLTIVDNLADGLINYLNGSVKGYLNGTEINVNVISTANNVTFTIDNVMNPGDNVIIVFKTSTPLTRPDVLTNVQNISANGGTTTGPIVSANPSASVELASYAALEIIKSANKPSIYSGDSLTYTFQITNSGNELANNVTFSDIFPTGYTINTITLTTPTSTTPVSYDPTTYVTGNTLTIPALTIPVGTSTLTVVGTYTN